MKIHEPYNKLKGALREKGLKYSDVAKALKISETALGNKINGFSDFYISQIAIIENQFGIGLDVFLRHNERKAS